MCAVRTCKSYKYSWNSTIVKLSIKNVGLAYNIEITLNFKNQNEVTLSATGIVNVLNGDPNVTSVKSVFLALVMCRWLSLSLSQYDIQCHVYASYSDYDTEFQCGFFVQVQMLLARSWLWLLVHLFPVGTLSDQTICLDTTSIFTEEDCDWFLGDLGTIWPCTYM
jgi:hypothetical protein